MNRLILVPLGELQLQLLNDLAETLKARFSCEVIIEMPEPDPTYSYNPKRKQFSSTMILERLKSETGRQDMTLGVTNADLYVPELNFVFGEAEVAGRVAVISLARLHPEFNGLSTDNGLLKERMLKEAVHELGHVIGLPHCPDKICVMHFSNSLRDTDIKHDNFCPTCRKKIGA